MNTRGILNRTNNMTRSWFSPFFFYICIILTFFYFKESTTVTTDKQRAKRIQQKNIQQCGGQVAPNSIWLGPSNKTKLSFFQLVLKLYPHLTFPFTIKGRELPRFLGVFLYFFFFFFHRRTRVSPLRLYGYTNFKQIGFLPKLAADEKPQKCFFGIALIRTFI